MTYAINDAALPQHTSPRALVSPIRAVEGAIYHLYLQNHGGKPQLGPEATEDYWTIGNTLLDNNSTLYLNVDRTVSTTYKPLSLGATATTTTWGLEGDTIIATNPRQNNFVACPTTNSSFWDLYLQEGNVVPSSTSALLQLGGL
ncbi:hypothetical protein DL96DRAFT_1709439 [Flagelloscypha sp. PMI_526]|nr:hypothetical protein DL96DRAFT_1709439 [Flagelloscypha sp. PMI_526]